MSTVNQMLAEKFVCSKCGQKGAHVEKLAMSGTGISQFLEVQLYRYVFLSYKPMIHKNSKMNIA